MVDSCAGLNLGKLSCHKSIHDGHPDIVHQFAYIKDLDNVEEFDIGGVARESPGLKVTALITHRTPFRIKGAPALVTFALSDGAAANTIVGLPFLRATRTALFMEEDGQDTVVVQKLGTTFRVEHHPPLVGDKAPLADRHSQAAFQHAPTEEELERETDEIRQKLADMFVTTGIHEEQSSANTAPAPTAAPEMTTAHPAFVPASVFEDHEQPHPRWHE
jgi:hypothetical protein